MKPTQLAKQRREIAWIERWARRLLGVSPDGIRERVERFREFVERYRIVEMAPGPWCPCRVRSRRCDPRNLNAGDGHHCCLEPDWLDLHSHDWLDHRRVWLTASGDRIFTSQPYELLETDRDRLREFLKRRGLRVSFSDEDSWWFPGKTTLVVLTADPAHAESVRRARAERGGAREVLLILLRAYHDVAETEGTTTIGSDALRYVRDLAVYRSQGGDAFADRKPASPPPEVQRLLIPTVDRMTEAVLESRRNRRFPRRSRVALEWLRDIRGEVQGFPSPLRLEALPAGAKP